VSACTFIHAAGVYRHGISYFHRGRRITRTNQPGMPPQPEPSMAELAEGLHKTELRVLAFYRKMDAGDAAIQAFQSTASETTLSASVPLMPRYVGDYLKRYCVSQERQAAMPHEEPSIALPQRPPSPQARVPLAERAFPASPADIHCISAAHSRERLLQFSKFCPGDCDHRALFQETTKRIRALLPEDMNQPQRQPPATYAPSNYPPGYPPR
jgi:hypothetical protein